MSILSLLMCLWWIKNINYFQNKYSWPDTFERWCTVYTCCLLCGISIIFFTTVFLWCLINCAVNIKVCLCFPWYVPFKSCLPYSRSKSLNKEEKTAGSNYTRPERYVPGRGDTQSNFPENTTSLYCLMPWVYIQLVYNFCADPHDLKWVRV